MKTTIAVTFIFSLFALVTIENASAEVIDLGNGYRCSGTTILNSKGKSIKLGTAKTSIQTKIDNVSGSSAKAKAKRNSLKTTKSNLTKCNKGQLSSGSPGSPGEEAPGDNNAILGRYTGTLTRVSLNDKTGGCADSATPTWTFRILVSASAGITYATGGSPFLGAFNKGGATTSGFKFTSSSLSVLRGADTRTLTGANLTDTSATITVTERHDRVVPKRPKGYEQVFSCEATYTGTFTRDKDAQN